MNPNTEHMAVSRWAALLLCVLEVPSWADVTGRVVSVTDGDTVKVLDDARVERKIRLSGIDAPERGQPYGRKSTEHLAGLIAGKRVVVESDKADRYGRLVGKILLEGRDVNLAQVEAGYAWWYRYYAKEQPPVDAAPFCALDLAELSVRKGLARQCWLIHCRV